MGLDAVVYKNRSNLPLLDEEEPAMVDDETGEVYFEDARIARKYGENGFVAIRRRLGNVASIDSLRSELSSKVGCELPILINKVLYSGSHSGDLVGVELLDSLEAELDLVSQRTGQSRSTALTVFIEDIRDLIRAARSERNPIVFV